MLLSVSVFWLISPTYSIFRLSNAGQVVPHDLWDVQERYYERFLYDDPYMYNLAQKMIDEVIHRPFKAEEGTLFSVVGACRRPRPGAWDLAPIPRMATMVSYPPPQKT